MLSPSVMASPKERFLPAHPTMARPNASANAVRLANLAPRRPPRTNRIEASRSWSIVPFAKAQTPSSSLTAAETYLATDAGGKDNRRVADYVINQNDYCTPSSGRTVVISPATLLTALRRAASLVAAHIMREV